MEVEPKAQEAQEQAQENIEEEWEDEEEEGEEVEEEEEEEEEHQADQNIDNGNQKECFIILANAFAKQAVYGGFSALWKAKFWQDQIKFEEVPGYQAKAKTFLKTFLVKYMNEGIVNMITHGQDDYFMENFSLMKATMNHGYRCLLSLVMIMIKITIGAVDLSQVKFDTKELVFDGLHEAIDKVLERFEGGQKKEHDFFNHKCESTNEDIHQWDPQQQFFPDNFLFDDMNSAISQLNL